MNMKPQDVAPNALTMAQADDDVILSRENIAWIREAILIGLTCYGELEKVINAKEMQESLGIEWPSYLDVRHPTGDCDVVSKFATALTVIDVA